MSQLMAVPVALLQFYYFASQFSVMDWWSPYYTITVSDVWEGISVQQFPGHQI